MYEPILKNIPGSPEWHGSFYERLVEDCVWDKDQFWELHRALITAASAANLVQPISRDLASAVAKIQSRVLRLVAAHYDPNDIFTVLNLAPDELREYVERFDHAILGVFSGEVIPESSYDLTNPLIVGSA